MDINVTGRHMENTESISNYARDKVADELSVFTRVESVHVIMDVEKYRHSAEVLVQGSNHVRIEGKAESDDMYLSLDQAIEKVVKQLRKSRDKVQSHKAEKLGRMDAEMQPVVDEEE